MTNTKPTDREIAESIDCAYTGSEGQSALSMAIASALSQARKESREETIRECAHIVKLHDCMHCGFIGDHKDFKCVSNSILHLLNPPVEGEKP